MSIRRRVRSAVVRAIPPAGVALVLGLLGHEGSARILVAVSLVLLLIGLFAPAVAAVIDRGVHRIEVAVVHGISLVLAVGAWAFVLLPVWAFGVAVRAIGRAGRSLRRRPHRTATATNWIVAPTAAGRAPDGSVADPLRSGSRDIVSSRSVTFGIFGALAATVLLTAGLVFVGRAVGISGGTGSSDGGSDGSGGRPLEWNNLPVDRYAHEDEPWAKAYFKELLAVPVKPDYMLGYRLMDVDGQYINIVDGVRSSYTPRDPELTVWFFGGSTMYGIGQRDDHTIPSVVAREAEADGIRIRVVNYGLSGFVDWQSLEQFEQLLSGGTKPPDLAVFYEGINETGLAFERTDLGDVRRGSISRYAISAKERATVRNSPDNTGSLKGDDERRNLVMEELAADQYRRGSMLIDALAESYGVPLVRFWQPSPFAKRPNPADDELWRRLKVDPSGLPESKRRYDAVRIRSGVDAIDLTTVLDDVQKPVYFDGAHTNELGARIVGNAIYQDIRPQLKQLAGR